jgi:hypothetical protein
VRCVLAALAWIASRLHKAMQKILLPLTKTQGHTIKYFKLMNHSVATIEWLGGLGWISSQFYEAAHLQLKWLYHSTTKRISGDK